MPRRMAPESCAATLRGSLRSHLRMTMPGCCRSFENRPCRPAFRLAECGGARVGESLLFLRAEETADRQLAATRNQEQPLDAEFRMHVAMQPHPQRIERPFADAAVMAHFAYRQLGRRDRQLF